MKHLYSVWRIPDNTNPRAKYLCQYHVTKHHRATLSEEQFYTIQYYRSRNWFRCDCPGFVNWHHCRHQQITEVFIKRRRIGSGALYDYEAQRWSNEFVAVPVAEH